VRPSPLSIRAWLGLGLALTILYWLADMAHGIQADAAWWLQLSDRLNCGDAPYRDFFLGVLPFPLWLTSAFTGLFGAEAWVLKLLVDATLVATALLAARIALGLSVSRLGALLVGLASLAFTTLPTASPYNALSHLCALAGLALVLAWYAPATRRPGSRLLLCAAGAAVGLSVAGKQTVGAAAGLALVASVILYSPRPSGGWRGRLADAALAAGVAAAVVVVVLIPVAITGGLDELWTQAFEKGEYVRTASVSYIDGVSELGRVIADPVTRGWDPRGYLYLVFVIPPLAAVLVVAATLRRPSPELLPVSLFAAAAVGAALPRAAYYAVGATVPFCAIAIAMAVSQMITDREERRRGSAPRGVRIAAAASGALLLALLAVSLFRAPLERLTDDPAISDLPHFSGVLIDGDQLDQFERQAEELRAADQGSDTTMILSYDAGFLYLISGVENVMAADYPAITTMREQGQDEAIEAISSGRILRVCLGNFDLDPGQRPERIESWVLTHMRPVDRPAPHGAELGPCAIYAPRV
jgi:NADH:ubiquinone oxidoreductase subunit 6 (subunit J)